MAAAGLTVLVDPERLDRQVLTGLREDLAAGGALLVLEGDPTAADFLGGTLLPAAGAARARRCTSTPATGDSGPGCWIGATRSSRACPTMPSPPCEDVAWRRWFRVPAAGAAVPLALAGDDPLLLTGRAGRGRWALLPFHLRPEAGDLPGSPMALPLLRRLAPGWPGRRRWPRSPISPWASDLRACGRWSRADRPPWTIPPPCGCAARRRNRTARPSSTWRGATPLLAGGRSRTAGIALFTSGRDTVGLAACGVPAAESDPALPPADVWAAPLRDAGLAVTADLADRGPEAVAAAFGGTELAPWLLAAAVLLLAVELWLGRGAAGTA